MKDPDIHIDLIRGSGPVVGRGTIDGMPFYFHARWDGWSFSLALHPDVDPQGITMSSERAFYVEGDYGQPEGYDASYMPEEEAEAIIRNCIKIFLEQQGR